MPTTHTKKDKDTLTVTKITNETHIVEEGRAEIQTKLDHLKLDAEKSRIDYSVKVDELEAKIAILDA